MRLLTTISYTICFKCPQNEISKGVKCGNIGDQATIASRPIIVDNVRSGILALDKQNIQKSCLSMGPILNHLTFQPKHSPKSRSMLQTCKFLKLVSFSVSVKIVSCDQSILLRLKFCRSRLKKHVQKTVLGSLGYY